MRNIIIMAKTLAAMAPARGRLFVAFCLCAMNHYAFAKEIDESAELVHTITSGELFHCWRDLRAMDSIRGFEELVPLVKEAWRSDDFTNGARRFCQIGESPSWARGLKPCFALDGYLFFNND